MFKVNLKKVKEFPTIFKPVVRLFILIYKQNPWFNLIYLLFITASSLLTVAVSFYWAGLIDALTQAIPGKNGSLSIVALPLAMYFIFLLFNNMLNSLRDYFDVIGNFNISKIIGSLLVKKYSSLDLEAHEDSKINNLIQKVEDNDWRAEGIMGRFFWVFYDLVSLVTSFFIIVTLSPLIMLLVIVGNLPTLFNQIYFEERVWGIWDTEAETRRRYFSTKNYLKSSLYLLELKVNGIRDFFIKEFENLYSRFVKKQKRVEEQKLFSTLVMHFLSTIFYLLSYVILIIKVLTGTLTIGAFTFYSGRIQNLSDSISRIFLFISNIYSDGLFVKELFDLLDLKSKVISGKKKIKTVPNAPLIEFKNVWFKYPGTKIYIFKNINLKILPAERWAIVGENGAGKTTLIKLLLRYYDVTKGEILINNINIKEIDLNDWYRYIAPLMQRFATYHYSAKTNIGLGNIARGSKLSEIKEAAKMSGAHDFITKYSKGYNQTLDRSYPDGTDPSIGQWQKIALARAFYKDSPILILDEPTSAIDPKAEYEIFQKLFDFAKNKTVIIISHRFSTVRNADRIIVLDNGKIVEEGSHSELIAKRGVYKEAYDLQKKGYEDV